jgi:Ca2+-binding RTX toxin-like protein
MVGGPGVDYMEGLKGGDVLHGGRGFDLLGDGRRRIDNDVYFGGSGKDQVFFTGRAPLTADLTTGQATGHGNDTLVAIEGLAGSQGGATLIGNDLPNRLFGEVGDDHLEGRGGNDFLQGFDGTDYLDGGTGAHDDCRNGETVLNCEM